MKRFVNAYRFSTNDIKRSILVLQKGVYPYEYMDDWEIFDQSSLPKLDKFYGYLNMEDNTDSDYTTQKEFVKILK